LKKLKNSGKNHNLMETHQVMSAVFLIAVLVLVLPGFLSTNSKIKQFMNNLSIWAVIVLIIVVIIYLIK
tara:strand:+ start:773 stop:979 length:207 start_codon:yes stop_codon:yes gene_type:complete